MAEEESHTGLCRVYKCCCKWKCVILWSLYLIYCGACGILLYWGAARVHETNSYLKNRSEEKCFVVSSQEIPCSYGCDCDDSGCSICDGIRYDYNATIGNKCGNDVILSSIYADSAVEICPEDQKLVNQTYTCWLLDCDNREFTFDTGDTAQDYGWRAIAASLVLIIGGLLTGLCVQYFCCKNKQTEESNEEQSRPNHKVINNNTDIEPVETRNEGNTANNKVVVAETELALKEYENSEDGVVERFALEPSSDEGGETRA